MRFILANTTWNSKEWTGASPDRSGFKWVASDPNKHQAHESWNFEAPTGKWKYGFFAGPRVRHFEDGGIVFFISRNNADGKRYITGFYAGATTFTSASRRADQCNLKARWSDCLKLPVNLMFRPERHLPSGTKTVRYFSYIEDVQAKNILSDMLGLAQRENNDGKHARRLYRIAQRYFPEIQFSRLKPATHKISSVGIGTLRRYIAKDSAEYVGPSTIKLSKDNAKLQRSYRDHEALKRKVSDYLEAKGYVVFTDKHLDLSARRGSKQIIVEVKSCRADNIECQVRLGTAQINYYAYLYRKHLPDARGMLAIQSRPSDDLVEFVINHCGYDLVFLSGDTLNHLKA